MSDTQLTIALRVFGEVSRAKERPWGEDKLSQIRQALIWAFEGGTAPAASNKVWKEALQIFAQVCIEQGYSDLPGHHHSQYPVALAILRRKSRQAATAKEGAST